MAFNLLESSNNDGEPIYLYEFRLNDNYWRYTSSTMPISMGGNVWKSISISDDGVKQSGETQVDALTVTMPNDTTVVSLFLGTPPINPLYLTMRRFHYGDTEAAVCYVGEVFQVNVASPVAAKVTCNTLSASMERNGLRLAWSRGCPYSLYDMNCGVSKERFRLDGEISTVGGSSIRVPEAARYDNRYFAGGYIEWLDPVRGVERRAIEDHAGEVITIFGVVDGLAGGMTIKIYPGCGRTTSECLNKFNNLDNYGGIPSMPDRSPFDGNPVF